MKNTTRGLAAGLIGSAMVAAGLLATTVTPAAAAEVDLKVITANTDFAKKHDAADWKYLRKTGADVVLFQEVKNVDLDKMIGKDWRVIQDTSSSAKQGSGIAVRISSVTSVEPLPLTLGTKVNSSCTSKPIQARYIASANLVLSNGAKVRVASLHMPPKRCFGKSYADMAKHVVSYAKAVGPRSTTILGADWNKKVKSDPSRIGHKTGLKPAGVKIDGFMFSTGVKVKGGPTALKPPRWHSDHKPVQIELRIPS